MVNAKRFLKIVVTLMVFSLVWMTDFSPQKILHESLCTESDMGRTSLASFIIGLQGNSSDALSKVENLVQIFGGRLLKVIKMDILSATVVEIPTAMSADFSRQVVAGGFTRYVEPNLQLRAGFEPNDPNWTTQWALRKIQADYAWNTTLGEHWVLISIVDTGIDYNHEDLGSNYNASGYNWVENNTDPMDPSTGMAKGHGTFCAGIIAATTNNGIGIAGLAQAQMMAERVGFYIDECAEAIKHSADNGARIISCSWGDYFDSNLLHDAIKYAYDKGVLIIAGAGNDNTEIPFYPAAYNEVLGISGTDESDSRASFSNYGDWIELSAPAVNISSTYLNNSYTYWSGTSFAGPHVVGVAALTWSQFAEMTRDQVRVKLRYAADDLGAAGFDNVYGYGRVNAKKAVEGPLPGHDLTILCWEPPREGVNPQQTVTFSALIHNFGSNDAHNVSSQLLVNGTAVDEVVFSILGSGETAIANYSWTPTQEGNYNLTCSLPPVSGETILVDNIRQTEVEVNYHRTIRVPSDYTTINAALAASNDEDTILVSPGTYNEQIHIEKSLSLLGSGRNVTTIRGHGGEVVTVDAPFAALSGFTICNGSCGVYLKKTAQNATIAENMVTDCGDGVYVEYGFGLKINHNVIHNTTIGLSARIGGTFEYCEVIGNNFTANTAFGIFDYAQYSRGESHILQQLHRQLCECIRVATEERVGSWLPFWR